MSDEEQQKKDDQRLPEASPESSETIANETVRHPRLVRAVARQVKAELRFSGFSGPLPPPEMLAAYKDAFPECPERIVAMAERQSQHRQDMEKADLEGAIKLRGRGQIIGALIAFAGLAGGVYLLANDKSVGGLAILMGDLAVFGGAFIYDRFFKKEPEQQPATQQLPETPTRAKVP